MIAVDTNILIYAHRQDSPWHMAARAALEKLSGSGEPFVIPWPCVHEFLAIVTHPGVYRPATPVDVALAAVERLLEAPSLQVIGELTGYWETLKTTVLSGKVGGPKFHDARIYSICLQHGVDTIWSADRDMSRFAGIRVVNPLIVQ